MLAIVAAIFEKIFCVSAYLLCKKKLSGIFEFEEKILSNKLQIYALLKIMGR